MTGQPSRYCGTAITAPPTFTGEAGEAWRLELPPAGQRGRPDFDASVGGFLLRAPRAHPLWDHYAISVIHLREMAGVRPPVIRTPGATHELMIMALDPRQALPSSLEAGPDFRLHYLTPIDVMEQFPAENDAVADQILELAVRAIVDGQGSPDQDWRAWWKEALTVTAEHFIDGLHTLGRPS